MDLKNQTLVMVPKRRPLFTRVQLILCFYHCFMFIPFRLRPNHCCYNLNYSRNKIRCIFQSWLAFQWVLINHGCFHSIFGKLSIIIGRKWAMVIAIILFEAGSLMCALANDMNVLIGGRVLAGIGGSGINSLVLLLGLKLSQSPDVHWH